MLITATDKPLRVDFRKAGKLYSQSPLPEGEGPGVNTDEKSDFPFDSVELQPGQNFNQTGVTVVRAVELGDDGSDPDAAPVSP